jgi:hypothetical protein
MSTAAAYHEWLSASGSQPGNLTDHNGHRGSEEEQERADEGDGADRRGDRGAPVRAYDRIRLDAGDVDAMADNLGISSSVIDRVKQHLFMREHDIPVGPGQVAAAAGLGAAHERRSTRRAYVGSACGVGSRSAGANPR